MRIRRKPWVRDELAKSDFFVKNPMENKGKWQKQFIRGNQPFHLELRMW